ncbi:MAG TPA: metallophosphoesterase [Firmicutes bacterium]|nr:metallophosphoesterase [Bacillota bacterium]
MMRDALRYFRRLKWTLPILMALFGTIVFINQLGRMPYDVEGLRIEVAARVVPPGAPGISRLAIPPIGRVQARTHLAPLRLTLTLKEVDPAFLQSRFAVSGDFSRFSDIFRSAGRDLIIRFITRLLILGALGGAFGVYLVRGALSRELARGLLSGGLTGLVVVSLLLSATWLTYDPDAFRKPEYQGIIEAAPWMLAILDKSVAKVGEIRASTEAFAANLSTLFNRAESLRPVRGSEQVIRVLHVSDIHNNPAAIGFIEKVIESFRVDLVIDTGDITDYGTGLEAALTGFIRDLGVPYVFVGGNHDSPIVLRTIAQYPNAVMVGGRKVIVRGIAIAGVDDPGSHRDEMAPASDEEVGRARAGAQRLLEGSGARPTIFVTHDYRVAEPFTGRVPVILYGHDHKLKVEVKDGTVVVDAGTTGGAGVRGLQDEKPLPLSLALLHISRRQEDYPGAKLVAVDTITLSSVDGGFVLERRVIEPQPGSESPPSPDSGRAG